MNQRGDRPPNTYSRRAALAIGGAAAVVAASPARLGASTAGSVSPARLAPGDPSILELLKPEIAPRSAWGQDLPVVGDVIAEDDVRFLLVHHTASSNEYGPDDVVDQIREFYGFHTGADKGWPDVAYNFFVDRFGGIWEARAGSANGPVRGDATGGSQGFALLCSLIGDHSRVEVSQEALDSLTRLLAWLAERHGLDTAPGATTDFVSRGSNRWPTGTAVTTNTISGHRDMSQTACPGDFAYDLLAEAIPLQVSARRSEAAAAAIASATTITTSATTAAQPASTEATNLAAGGDPQAQPEQAQPAPAERGPAEAVAILIGAAAILAAAIAAGADRFRRRTDG